MCPLIEAKNISKHYKIRDKEITALKNISLTINSGDTVAVVGESGSGKSTLGRLLTGLENPSSGEILYHGKPSPFKNTAHRKNLQMVFQDTYHSLNPKMTIEKIIGEGLYIHQLGSPEERKLKVLQALSKVGLDPSILTRFPKQLSGGQRQRIVTARALVLNPEFVVFDEAVASLDTCTKREIIEMFVELKDNDRLTYVFITHDINVVKMIADYIAVLYMGQMVEYGPTAKILNQPEHPYTQSLLNATFMSKHNSVKCCCINQH